MLGMALSKADQAEVWKSAIAATRLMIITGWRRGEVLGLRWFEVDLPRRIARLADTKTGASLRALSLAHLIHDSERPERRYAQRTNMTAVRPMLAGPLVRPYL
jgi:integrase